MRFAKGMTETEIALGCWNVHILGDIAAGCASVVLMKRNEHRVDHSLVEAVGRLEKGSWNSEGEESQQSQRVMDSGPLAAALECCDMVVPVRLFRDLG